MKKSIFYLMACAVCLMAYACSEKKSNATDEPLHNKPTENVTGTEIEKKESGTIRIMSYNVGVFNKYIKDGYEEVAKIIKEAEADIMLFQELDSCANRTGNVDQLKHICSMLGNNWSYKFGAGLMSFQGGKYGVGIAAKKTPLDKTAKNLGKYNDAENRGLAVMEFDDYVVASTHLGLKEQAQINQLNEITTFLYEKYGKSGKTVILGGDLNAAIEYPLIDELKKNWSIISTTQTATYSTEADKYCIDYILVLNSNKKVTVKKSKVVREAKSANVKTASDHYPVFVDIIL